MEVQSVTRTLGAHTTIIHSKRLYYILNDSSTTKDAYFHVESSKSVTPYKLLVFMCKYSCMYDNETQAQAEYDYDCTKRATTYQLLLVHQCKPLQVFANTLSRSLMYTSARVAVPPVYVTREAPPTQEVF